MNSYATFWSGSRLSAFETACLMSFIVRGHSVTVYSYEPIDDLPPPIKNEDAAVIAPKTALDAFVVQGVSSLSHFSDFFRYNLFRRTDHTWIDADMLLIGEVGGRDGELLLAQERANSICGAIMKLKKGKELDRLIDATAGVMGKDLSWGETGPKLLTRIFGHQATFKNSLAPNTFFPITHDEFWRVFLPSERSWCDNACRESRGVHLWNNIVDRLGIWKKFAPPKGSWLTSRYEIDGTIELFDDFYPENVMKHMVENWRLRKTGGDIGVKALCRQIAPSVFRTARHYFGPRGNRIRTGKAGF